jgi:hypothetical protein
VSATLEGRPQALGERLLVPAGRWSIYIGVRRYYLALEAGQSFGIATSFSFSRVAAICVVKMLGSLTMRFNCYLE